MKILYIDHISPNGHVNFNKIHLQALLSLKHDIYCIFKKDYLRKINIENIIIYKEIPLCLYKNNTNGFIERVFYLLQLLFIKFNAKFSTFDFVIFAAYEPISLFFAKIKTPTFLINHNTISGLDKSRLKEFFTKKISKKNIHLVFDKHMQKRLEKSKIFKSKIIPHGYCMPFTNNLNSLYIDSLNEMDHRIYKSEYSIIFCPSSTSIDKEFVFQIITNERFNNFLFENKIILLIKGNYNCNFSFNKNIISINRFFTDIEYQFLLKLSKVIILPYGKDFKYRTSGIMFECFSNNIPCLISNIASMRTYSAHFNYNPYFNNISDLQFKILTVLNEIKYPHIYLQIDKLNPLIHWSYILKNNFFYEPDKK